MNHPDLKALSTRGYIHDSELDSIIHDSLIGIINIDPNFIMPRV